MRKVLVLTCLLAVIAGLSVYVSAQGRAMERPVSQMKWEPAAPGSPLQISVLWGDRAKGPEYAMLLKMPAGSEAGWHSHTGAYHAVAVSGIWVHTSSKEGKPIELPPGGFVTQPGKTVHNDSCKGPSECVIFIHQHTPGDFIPAK